MKCAAHRPRGGMSMVEIMIGVIILALILIPSLNVIISETKTVTATRDHTQASFFAQQILEAARACPFDLLDADQYNTDENTKKKTFEYALNTNDEIRKGTINGITYEVKQPKIKFAADKSDASNRPNMVYLSFRVEYKGQDTKTHTLDVFTAISKRQ
ncbi:MAG TPA: hypothetical protein PLP29_11025 [Candidatus Ozemobacteraceae bacterium]|nr:hypothetical protein [Candidatus Ozemobacteraceae bacterium]